MTVTHRVHIYVARAAEAQVRGCQTTPATTRGKEAEANYRKSTTLGVASLRVFRRQISHDPYKCKPRTMTCRSVILALAPSECEMGPYPCYSPRLKKNPLALRNVQNSCQHEQPGVRGPAGCLIPDPQGSKVARLRNGLGILSERKVFAVEIFRI